MKTYKAIISLLLAILLTALTVGATPASAAADGFVDIAGHWAEATLQKSVSDGLLEGYGDGTVRPNNPITAPQLITIITRVLNVTGRANISHLDIPEDAWYYEAAQKAASLGLIPNGLADGPMTRQDAFALMARAFLLTMDAPALSVLDAFYDNELIREENRGALASLVYEGLVQGNAGALNVNGELSRAEFMAVLYRTAESQLSPTDMTGMTIDTARLNARGGGVLVNDSSLKYIVVSGSGQVINISGNYETLTISGSNNVITFSDSAQLGSLKLTGSNNSIVCGESDDSVASLTVSDAIEFGGVRNVIDLNGSFPGEVTISGTENQVFLTSSEPLSLLNVPGHAPYLSLDGSVKGAITITGNFLTLNQKGEGSTESLIIDADSGIYSFSEGASFAQISISGQKSTLTLDGSAALVTVTGYKTALKGAGTIDRLILNASGCTAELAVTNLEDNSAQYDRDRVLNLVSNVYSGNFTLAWAEAHDYEAYEKEIWVNAKGYSSRTEYLIWVNLAMQRVNIFQGGEGNWKLIRSCIIGSGAMGSKTPVGVYYTTYKLASGWTTATYTCRPVVGFKLGSGYAFHSRLYYPNSNRLTDASIGFPVSHGCIRMYDEDINFIYNSIPLNTTVVVY
ncbi:MAG: S-layer homology domain-containing protein [Oscillospiraceae bacterium]|jgi:lipoprotein-anchoring transpeptidase ErfK/SrfK|nr:S-layer homology domain-containing protein [Oscillospiraceae bacterium]